MAWHDMKQETSQRARLDDDGGAHGDHPGSNGTMCAAKNILSPKFDAPRC